MIEHDFEHENICEVKHNSSKFAKKHVKEFISIFRRKQRLLELKPGETIPERCCWQRESPQRCITNSSFGHFQTPYLVKTRNTYIYIYYIAPKNYWIIMQWSLPRPSLLCPTTFHLKKMKKSQHRMPPGPNRLQNNEWVQRLDPTTQGKRGELAAGFGLVSMCRCLDVFLGATRRRRGGAR